MMQVQPTTTNITTVVAQEPEQVDENDPNDLSVIASNRRITFLKHKILNYPLFFIVLLVKGEI
jgi:hypothetical protein